MKYCTGLIYDYWNKPYSHEEVFKALVDAGFKDIFLEMPHRDSIEETIELAKKYHISISSVHASFFKMAYFWQKEETKEYIEQYNEVKEAILIAEQVNSPIVVFHYYFGENCVQIDPNIILPRVISLIEFAKKHHVTICLENLAEHIYYFKLLADELFPKYDNFRFCFDVGHDHFSPYSLDVLHTYKKYLRYVHIADNLGAHTFRLGANDDLHLLPFDGNLDYSEFIKVLKEINFEGPLTFELANRHWVHDDYPYYQKYRDLGPKGFYKEAYKRAEKLNKMFYSFNKK